MYNSMIYIYITYIRVCDSSNKAHGLEKGIFVVYSSVYINDRLFDGVDENFLRRASARMLCVSYVNNT